MTLLNNYIITAHAAIHNAEKVRSAKITLTQTAAENEELHLQAGRFDKEDNTDARVSPKSYESEKAKLPFVSELHRSRDKRRESSTMFANPLVSAEFSSPPSFEPESERTDGSLKSGPLYKTTLSRREGAKPGPTRHRQFRLTEVALEYLHLFSHVRQSRATLML